MARLTTRPSGGFTFAEHPERAAPDARIIWHADLDPGALRVVALPAALQDPDGIDLQHLAPWLTLAVGSDDREHAVLSDGWNHIRLDLEAGSLISGPVVLHYRLHGRRSAETRLLPLRRFLHLCRHRRFAASLFPADSWVPRGLILLRVHDALRAGASHREMADALFGEKRVARDWRDPSESLRSRIRRLVTEARSMARGGYRSLMRR
ncbi:hypothetical protein ACVWZA_004023 [Sphingomonas sp. UYAg733]